MEGYLHLADGKTFQGKWLGNTPEAELSGEVVFYTGMTGYQEVLTDPSYKDQIIVFTYPLIGNYGINKDDFESQKPHAKAVIIYEGAQAAFHYEAKTTFCDYLQHWNIPILCHVDTRAVTKRIRENGSMPALLSSDREAGFIADPVKEMKVNRVSVKQQISYGTGRTHIVLIDYGCKKSIVESLLKRDCKVTVVPFNATFEQISALKPDGVLLSNGPGDPKDVAGQLKSIKKVIESYPVLGICLGHQLAALALGADTKKMLFGHRGANHPVTDKATGRVFMSSQNHSFVVDDRSLEKTGLSIRFYNSNDGSVEGLSHPSLPLTTVQFHPEANPGPEDSAFVFTEFIENVKSLSERVVNYA
ncbi:carbamoyl phosphate synthase small subunit [Bacillus sp. T33-2]|uniref:carbamoyl phosphate synthase small subunit n=1 Tax=Bacillus sp. T33-2 TaxID=2054168 RepID=UPI000C788352|nr:carbamoyl phosphate synthase small subunit [Bacillus sp. T33-2]PLR97628.1 carbamoyl phosphate synthase small subunit [Bacillus sp. T33-2]